MEKKKTDMPFSTEELIHLMYQQIEAHKHLEYTRNFHGDVRPIYWALNSNLWHSKLIHKPEDINNKDQVLLVQTKHIEAGDKLYLSPYLYESLMAKKYNLNFNFNKEDMFATAMVLLELGLQNSLQNVYKPDGKFDHQAMIDHVARFEEIYSGPENQLLLTTILTMLEPEDNRRPHFILLSEKMPSYYSIVRYFENLRLDPKKNREFPLETFMYVDQKVVESFTLEPGVKQIKVDQNASEQKNDVVINSRYSNRRTVLESNNLHKTTYTGSGKVVERAIRRFEERNGKLVEKVEHFEIREDEKAIKTMEYEVIENKRVNIKYFNEIGHEITNDNNSVFTQDEKKQQEYVLKGKNSMSPVAVLILEKQSERREEIAELSFSFKPEILISDDFSKAEGISAKEIEKENLDVKHDNQ